jgi:MOSC domain-containing protein YiiM
MYADPTHIRDNPIKVRLNDDEYAAIEALARLNKRQPAVFARELLMQGISLLEQRTDEAHAA